MILNDVKVIIKDRLVKRDVELENGKVKTISESLPQGENCTAKLLIPGFANAHSHLASRLLKGLGAGLSKFKFFTKYGFKAHKHRTKEDVYNAALLAGIELLKNGVTNVLTMDVHPKPVIKALEELGLNYLAGYALKDEYEEAQNVNESFKLLKSLNKTHKDKIYVGLANEVECSPQLMREALDFAQEEGMQLHLHAMETKDEVSHIRRLTGKRTIPYLESLGYLDYDASLAHCTYADTKDILLISNYGVPVIHCPTSNEAISNNVPQVKTMLEHQVKVGLGTDSFPWNPDPDLRHEALKALRLNNLSIKQAYSLLLNGHLLWEPEYGVIEGAPANLLLIDYWKVKADSVNKILYNILSMDCINSVIINGEYKLKNKRLVPKINERLLIKKVESASKRIINEL